MVSAVTEDPEVRPGRPAQLALAASLARGDSEVQPEALETLEKLDLEVQLDQLVHRAREEIQGTLVVVDLLDLLVCKGHLDRLVTEDHRVSCVCVSSSCG